MIYTAKWQQCGKTKNCEENLSNEYAMMQCQHVK
jgi:hypothetical protein